MNGRIARKLRKLTKFEPKANRYYFCTNNANNFVFGNGGELERLGGTIIEATIDKNPVTTRAHYKYLKRKFYDGTF